MPLFIHKYFLLDLYLAKIRKIKCKNVKTTSIKGAENSVAYHKDIYFYTYLNVSLLTFI